MNEGLGWFERVARVAGATGVLPPAAPAEPQTTPPTPADEGDLVEQPHPFETRNIHPDLPKKVLSLFDDGHFSHAVFEAFKYIEKEVKRISGIKGKVGVPLMMAAFNETSPKIPLTNLVTESEIDEQLGYKHLFAGAMAGIRNPRGHEVDVTDTPDEGLDYLALASLLLRRLDMAEVR